MRTRAALRGRLRRSDWSQQQPTGSLQSQPFSSTEIRLAEIRWVRIRWEIWTRLLSLYVVCYTTPDIRCRHTCRRHECDGGISVLYNCLEWYKFVNTHLYHSRQLYNIQLCGLQHARTCHRPLCACHLRQSDTCEWRHPPYLYELATSDSRSVISPLTSLSQVCSFIHTCTF